MNGRVPSSSSVPTATGSGPAAAIRSGADRPARGRALPSGHETGRGHVALLTGGGDRPYTLGLATALLARGVRLDFIASDDLDSPLLRTSRKLTFLNLRGNQDTDSALAGKVWRVLLYYARLIRYAWSARPKIFHILWNNKLQYFDRTLLMLYYRLSGKRVVLTAHNVNAGQRDSNDSLLNRLTLRVQYRLADHVFVHTEAMKRELLDQFALPERAVTVIPFGINNAVPTTDIAPGRARQRLGIGEAEKAILFFGNIGPYKGLEFLVAAFQEIAARDPGYRLIIAGRPRPGCRDYAEQIRRAIDRDRSRERVVERIEYVPDEDTELYFKAADVLVLPYTRVSQSGVLVLAYSFGLPVIAADVGSLREDVVIGATGFLCRPCDPLDLATKIEAYFRSELFENLGRRRRHIRDWARERYSWDAVSQATCSVYERLRGTDPMRSTGSGVRAVRPGRPTDT